MQGFNIKFNPSMHDNSELLGTIFRFNNANIDPTRQILKFSEYKEFLNRKLATYICTAKSATLNIINPKNHKFKINYWMKSNSVTHTN